MKFIMNLSWYVSGAQIKIELFYKNAT